MIPGGGPGARGPSAALPLAYLGTAAAALVVAATMLPALADALAGHYYHPRILAVTHVVALGWITLAIIGATYQLIPVAVERPLWSERLARWQLPVLVAGIIGMVGHFWMGLWTGLAWAAALVAAAALAHAANVALSLRGGRAPFTARGIALGATGLALTALLGLTLGATHGRALFPGGVLAALHAHFHLALLSWIAPMIVGVGARIYPMFFLAPEPGARGARVQLGGLAVGVPVLVLGLLLGRAPLALGGALAVAAALAVHAAWVVRFARQGRRPRLDWGLRLALAGTAALVPGGALGLTMAAGLAGGPRLALAYAVLALGGWVSLTIAGVMLKIVPFLVWYRVYAPRAGREPVPTLAQLAWPGAERLACLLLTGGTAALAATVAGGWPAAIAAAGAVVAAGALALAAALGRVLWHLVTGPVAPRLDPATLPARPR